MLKLTTASLCPANKANASKKTWEASSTYWFYLRKNCMAWADAPMKATRPSASSNTLKIKSKKTLYKTWPLKQLIFMHILYLFECSCWHLIGSSRRIRTREERCVNFMLASYWLAGGSGPKKRCVNLHTGILLALAGGSGLKKNVALTFMLASYWLARGSGLKENVALTFMLASYWL